MVAVATAVAIATAPASATHAGCLSYAINDWYTDNRESFLIFDWINWSYWDSTHDYIARRYTNAWEKTFEEWHPGSEPVFGATSSSGNNVYRITSQQRAGYGWVQYGESQYKHC